MASVTIVLRDPATGVGLPGQTVVLKRGPGFSSTDYTLTDVAGKPGAYKVTGVTTAVYKLFVNGTVDDSFGGDEGREIFRTDDLLLKAGGTMTGNIAMGSNRITGLPTPAANDEPETKGNVSANYLKLTGGTLSGPINADGQRITALPNPASSGESETKGSAEAKYLQMAGGTMTGNLTVLEAAGDNNPVRKVDADSAYAKKGANLDPVETMQIYNQFIFRTLPYMILAPTHVMHPANRLFVENYCTALLSSINPSAYQQSGNIIRLIPSGVVETDKVYREMVFALDKAEDLAASDRHMIIEFHGNGTGSTAGSYNMLPSGVAEPYVHIIGMSQAVIMGVSEANYEGTAGANIISNLTIDNYNEDAETTFENKVFYNVKFQNSFGSGTPVYHFINCVLIGCSITTVYTFTTCKGDIYDLALDRHILLGNLQIGSYTVADYNADVRPRRLLGRQATHIASDAAITLGNGNFFVITGTTTISTISTSGWTDGSVVHLFFTASLTLDTGGGNLARIGGDLIPAAGQVVSFLLDASTWIILEV
ncbi:MAG: hypothetical protein IPM96_15880 [Ignavibacteria bacterium]|nr:hypothetical protein [Ignavibacteria bacterium]